MGLQVTRRVASAHSQGYSYTYALRNIDFATAISPYPEEGKAIIRKIKQVLDLKASKNATNNRPIATNDPSPTPTPATTTPAPSTPTSSFSMDSPPIVSSLPINSKSFYHPDSLPRQLWGLLLLLIFLYNMFMIPLRFSLSITPYLYILDYLLDGILLINLYLIYCKFYTLHRGVYVTDTHGLRDLFLKENFSYGYFACIPFDILGIFMINQPPSYLDYTLKICRITKLFIVFDASLYAKYTLSLLEKLRIPYFATIILRMFITVCLIGHWSACGFYLIPSYVNRDSDHEDQYTGTWIEFQINSNKLPLDGGNQWTRYIRSLNWSIPTLTLVVIADIFPVNNEEMMYGLLVMFFGFMLNGAVVGTMITLLTRDSSESTDVHIVRNLLETRNVDLNLRIRVVQHLNFLSSTAGQLLLEEESMIKELPFSLQLAIVENTKLPLLNKCPLFDTCSEESKRNLCLAFRQQIYCDGDLIIKCGDIGQEMYFLIEGSVDVR